MKNLNYIFLHTILMFNMCLSMEIDQDSSLSEEEQNQILINNLSEYIKQGNEKMVISSSDEGSSSNKTAKGKEKVNDEAEEEEASEVFGDLFIKETEVIEQDFPEEAETSIMRHRRNKQIKQPKSNFTRNQTRSNNGGYISCGYTAYEWFTIISGGIIIGMLGFLTGHKFRHE